MRKLVLLSLMTLAPSLLPAPAAALGLLTPEGATMVVDEAQVVAVPGQGSSLMIEQLELRGDARRFVMLRVFPKAPTAIRGASPELLEVLEGATTVAPPLHLELKRRMFGPSILTALLMGFGSGQAPATPSDEEAAKAKQEKPELPRATFDEAGVLRFSGPITSSTITGQRYFPPDFDAWLNGTLVALPRTTRDALLSAFAAGSTIVAMQIDRPQGEGPFLFGPIEYRLAGPVVTEPMLLPSGPSTGVKLRTYALHPTLPFTPSLRDAVFNDTPWEGPRGSSANVVYWGQPGPEVQEALSDRFALTSSVVRVARSELRYTERPTSDTTFLTPRGAIDIPGRAKRGSGIDLFLCIMMGLAPLLYAPESWLLLWITANARDRLKRGQTLGLVGAMWPLYALLVAGYWMYTLSDLGRTAALGPLLIGVIRLFMPPEDNQTRQIRVDFARKKRANMGKTERPKGAKPDGRSLPPKGEARSLPPKAKQD